MDENALLEAIARPGMLAVLRILNEAKAPVSIRGLGVHAQVSASGTHSIVRKLSARGFVKTTKTKRDVLVEKAAPFPNWIGLMELDPPKSFVASVPGFGKLTVFRHGAVGEADGPVVEMRVLPEFPTDADKWLALYVHDAKKALALLKPGALDLIRLRRRVHQEQLYRHAVTSGLAPKIGLQPVRGRQAKPRRDARRREATKDDED